MKKLIFGVFLAVCWCTGTVKAQDIAGFEKVADAMMAQGIC